MREKSYQTKVLISLYILIFLSIASASDPIQFSSNAIGSSSLKNLSNNSGHSSDPMIETEQDNLYVVWHDTTPGNADVFLAKSTDNGTSFGNITNISNNRGNSLFPQLAVDDSDVYVVWQDDTNGNKDIFFTRFNDNGTSFGNITNLSHNSADSIKPQVISESGNVYVVWHDTTPGNADVFLAKSTDNGTSFGNITNISNNRGNSLFPQLAVDGSDVYIVWTDYSAGGQGFVASSHDNGNSFGNTINLSETPFINFTRIGHSSSPRLVQNMHNIFIVWQDNWNGNSDILFTKSTDSGDTFSNASNLSNDSEESTLPQVSISGHNLLVVWQGESNGNNDILFTKSIDSGNTFGNASKLSNNSGDSLKPQVISESENVYVVWHDTTPGNADVFLAKSTDNGTGFSNITNLSNNRGNSLNPQIIKFEDKTYAVWKDFSSGNGDILLY